MIFEWYPVEHLYKFPAIVNGFKNAIVVIGKTGHRTVGTYNHGAKEWRAPNEVTIHGVTDFSPMPDAPYGDRSRVYRAGASVIITVTPTVQFQLSHEDYDKFRHMTLPPIDEMV